MIEVLKFYTDTCVPCKMITPILEELCSEYNLELKNIDATVDHGLVSKYGVRSVPTTLIIEDGIVLNCIYGYDLISNIRRTFKKALQIV